MMEAELKAARTLLQRGVEEQIPAPLLLRLFGKKKLRIVLRQPSLGTLIRMSEIYLSTGITDTQLADTTLEEALRIMRDHGKSFARIIAVAYLNGYWSGKLFSGLVTKSILLLDPRKIFALITLLFTFSGAEDFMSTIRSVRNMKITEPTLSQTSQGS